MTRPSAHPPPQPGTHHIAGWQRVGAFTVGAVLLLTGLGWLGVHYTLGGGAGELPHPLEAWAMRVHGAATFASLFMLGAVAATHVPHGWRLSRRPRWAQQRGSGLLLCGLGAALAFSGYLLYYFAPEAVRPSLGWVHAGAGVAMAVLLALHRRGRSNAR